MSRYIDADALMEHAEQYLKSYNDMYEAMESGYTDEERDAVDAQRCTATGFVALIHNAPTVDAVPVDFINQKIVELQSCASRHFDDGHEMLATCVWETIRLLGSILKEWRGKEKQGEE